MKQDEQLRLSTKRRTMMLLLVQTRAQHAQYGIFGASADTKNWE